MDLKEHQPPLDVEQQIDNLISIGLTVNDKESAMSFLNDVSYFRFIKAYSLGLKEKNGNYHEGVTFDQIKHLYLFNSRLRQLIFTQIEKVEVNLRCRIANYFSYKYGVLGYLERDNFADIGYHEELMEDIEHDLNHNKKAPFVRNFQDNYVGGTIPLYAVIELFSFGTLSKFYKNMKSEDKKAVAKMYGVGYTYFESWIESIAFVRNVCAHYGRLYNAKLAKTPTLYKDYIGIRNNRLFATLLCLKHLLPDDEKWREFIDGIELLLEKYHETNIALMGFPAMWKDILLERDMDKITARITESNTAEL